MWYLFFIYGWQHRFAFIMHKSTSPPHHVYHFCNIRLKVVQYKLDQLSFGENI